eukprot:sb/3476800/
MVKQKRKEKAGKWAVPIPKVKQMGRMRFSRSCRLVRGRRRLGNEWLPRLPMLARISLENHPNTNGSSGPWRCVSRRPCHSPRAEATFCLPMIGVKKNPNSPMYTQLGVSPRERY